MPTKRETGAALELYGVLGGQLAAKDCQCLGKKPPPRRQTEAAEQTALFQWARLSEKLHPELALLFHVPNGGRRDAIEGAHLKEQGVRAGVPDICLPVARGGYHALYIEPKAAKGRVQASQKWWIEHLASQGCKAVSHPMRYIQRDLHAKAKAVIHPNRAASMPKQRISQHDFVRWALHIPFPRSYSAKLLARRFAAPITRAS